MHDYGAYLTMHNAPGGMTSTAFTLGAVGAYQGSTERRQWGIAQANVSNRYLSLYLLQEVDYYPAWKLQGPNAQVGAAVSFTSQFANVSARPKARLFHQRHVRQAPQRPPHPGLHQPRDDL